MRPVLGNSLSAGAFGAEAAAAHDARERSDCEMSDVQPQDQKSSTGLDANVASALAYIPIVAIIFLVIEKGSRLVKFHSVQSLGLAVGCFIIWFGLMVVGLIPIIGWLTLLLWPIFGIAMFVIWLIALLKAFKGEWYKLPVIGDIAEKQSATL
jgi:uncharacterized membrane protein